MHKATQALSLGHKVLTREEALGREANSALLQGGTIADAVRCTDPDVGSEAVIRDSCMHTCVNLPRASYAPGIASGTGSNLCIS